MAFFNVVRSSYSSLMPSSLSAVRGFVSTLPEGAHVSSLKGHSLQELIQAVWPSDRFSKYCIDPKTGKDLKATFSKVSEEDKQKFVATGCLLTLSIGQPIHSGASLAASLELIDKHFSFCTLVLGDTLQRHTMALTKTSETDLALMLESKEKGDQWIKDNRQLLSILSIPWNIRRWDFWLMDKRFNKLLSMIQNACNTDAFYRKHFEDNIERYLERIEAQQLLAIDKASAFTLCLRYLQEKCAVMCLWPQERCGFEVYASERTPAMQATYERFIEGVSPDSIRPVSLRFKAINQRNKKESVDVTEGLKHGHAKYLLK